MTKKKNTKVPKTEGIRFPANVLAPVADFLKQQVAKLERDKKKVEESDPFINEDRVADNAAADTEAEEQFGHALTTAVQDRIDRKIIQTRKALSRIKIGKYGVCENCGNMIDTDRLVVYPETTRCINCEKKR